MTHNTEDLVNAAFKKAAANKPAEIPPLEWIDISTWDDEPVPEQEWAVANRIPLLQTALFSGEGSAGKSTLQ